MPNNQKTGKTVRLDDIHWKILKGLTPFYGSNEGEVIRNILIMWFHENLGSETLKVLEKSGIIKLKGGGKIGNK